MPEHTPAPTPARSIYGFVMYLSFKTVFVIYLGWALIPDKWLNTMNIYYYPQKYWAVAVPIQLLVAVTLFAFFIYPGLNLAMTPGVDDMRTITDNFALKRKAPTSDDAPGTWCDCRDKRKCHLKNNCANSEVKEETRIPHVEDLDIKEVCRKLYSK